jgi:hypothetical protein
VEGSRVGTVESLDQHYDLQQCRFCGDSIWVDPDDVKEVEEDYGIDVLYKCIWDSGSEKTRCRARYDERRRAGDQQP